MKSIVKVIILLGIAIASGFAFGQESLDELRARGVKIISQQADVEQIISQNDKILSQGSGKFLFKNSHAFKLHLSEPDESILVVNGEQVWFYEPIIEQVTLLDYQKVVNNSPFGILSKQGNWQDYKVWQNKDHFFVQKRGDDGWFFIEVDDKGIIKSFGNQEADGLKNNYILKNNRAVVFEPSLFDFVVPKGVVIDDQREFLRNRDEKRYPKSS